MTTQHPALQLVTASSEDTVRIEITGDLDRDNAELLSDEVTAQLDARPDLKDLHLHCAGIGAVDAMGLSVLLMISRRTTAAGTRLHLDDRSAKLDRLLDITGTLAHLTATTPTPATTSQQHVAEPSIAKGRTQAARFTGPDGIT
ncbi:STAS domain-containing protein [Streptomyces sp. MI02-7b]|uniref:STAS domain-containing protein n=1 Tax=Streptomyces sp. MI02-7b TaxID=462941 RepID=UPI0029A0346A|nr:STAS domain-containing protein [Streptomyces sp. MI02-7b]MDX3074048.1 STAS domain-containing protein [Streptomyces sp. MI02-7b]